MRYIAPKKFAAAGSFQVMHCHWHKLTHYCTQWSTANMLKRNVITFHKTKS